MKANQRFNHQRALLNDYVEYGNLDGMADVTRNWPLKCWRATYLLATISLNILCIINMIILFIEFFKYPTTTKVVLAHEDGAPFPAVTFCNLNAVRISQLSPEIAALTHWASNTMGDEYKSWDQLHGDVFVNASNDVFSNFGIASYYSDLTLGMYYDLQLNLSSVGHQLEDMLADCEFQKVHCTPKNFTQWVHPVYGNCFTFMTNDPSFTGPDNGLKLTLYTNPEEYLPLTFKEGFRLAVHEKETVPFPDDQGLNVSPGISSAIGLRKMVILRQPLPYDNADCGRDEDHSRTNVYRMWDQLVERKLIDYVTYSQKACEKTCQALIVRHLCDCIDASILTLPMTKYYDSIFGDAKRKYFSGIIETELPFRTACAIPQKSCTKKASRMVSLGICSSICPAACRECAFEVLQTGTIWPRANIISAKLVISLLSRFCL